MDQLDEPTPELRLFDNLMTLIAAFEPSVPTWIMRAWVVEAAEVGINVDQLRRMLD